MLAKKTLIAAAVTTILTFSATSYAQVSEHSFRLGTANPKGHPIVSGAEKFAEIVKQKMTINYSMRAECIF